MRNSEHEVLPKGDLLRISSRFEIGGHTAGHVDLTTIPPADVSSEIITGKEQLEDLLGKPLSMFCYPRGHFNEHIQEQVRKAGFSGARTASWFHGEYPTDPFRVHPTLHLYPHSPLVHIGHAVKEMNFRALRDYVLLDRATSRLTRLAHNWLQRIALTGGIFHLWGHSWEIEDLGLWSELESILSSISQMKHIVPLTNGEILQRMRPRP